MARFLLLIGLLAAAALPGGCRRGDERRLIEVSVIGALPVGDALPAGPALSPPAALLADATATGLVRLDRDGQVIAGAAARWAILDDGLDYIFRIDDAADVSAREIARRLRAAVRARRASPDHGVIDAIESIAAVTATVIEIRLTSPQPDLLLVLAQPEYGLGAAGPMRVATRSAGAVLLAPRAGAAPRPQPVRLHGETVGQAVARFRAGERELVLGGTFDDLAAARAAQPPRGALRFDPASGLFGLVLRDGSGPAADPAVRKALGLAIDRDRIVAAIGAAGLAKATTLAGSTIEPPLAERRAEAMRLLGGRTIRLSVAMPAGAGGQALFAELAQDWASVGITATRAAPDAKADLALVDRVTPAGSRAAIACALAAACDPADRIALIDPPFIPIAAPVRWALVAKRLDRFTENKLAVHPLDRLVSP